MQSQMAVDENSVSGWKITYHDSKNRTQVKMWGGGGLNVSLKKYRFYNDTFSQVVNTVSYLIPEFLNFIFSILNPALQRVLCSIQIFFYVVEFLHSEAQMNKS